jgi:hypothetical protein
MPSYTIQTVMDGAFRLIGAYGSGESADATAYADGIAAANDMLESWSVEMGLVHWQDRASYPLSANVSGATIGPSGDFNGVRPLRIEYAYVLNNSSQRVQRLVLLNKEQFAEISRYPQSSTYPTHLLYSASDVAPNGLGGLNWFPTPSASGYSLELFYPYQLPTFSIITDPFVMPPGYREAVRYNLAVRLAMEWGRPLDQALILRAEELRANLRSINASVVGINPLQIDPGLVNSNYGSAFNWRTGDYY